MLGLLRDRNFLLLWLSQVVSNLGSALTLTAVLVLAVQTYGASAVGISLILFSDAFPSILFGPIAGTFADRHDKKTIIVSMDVLRAGVVFLLLLSVPLHSILVTFALLAVMGLMNAYYSPAKTSAIPQLLGEERVSDALGASSATSSATQIVGMALGGVVMSFWGPKVAFGTDAVSFLLSALFMMFLPLMPGAAGEAQKSFVAAMLEGADAIRQAPVLRFLLGLLIPVTLVLGLFNMAMTAVLLKDLRLTAAMYGLNESVFGIGAIFGAVLGSRLLKKVRPGSLLLWGVGLCGATLAMIVPVRLGYGQFGVSVIFLWSVATGVIVPVINVPLSSLFLVATPKPMRARGAALMQSVIHLCMMIGLLTGGMVAQYAGAINLTWIAGAALILTALIAPTAKGFRALQEPAQRSVQTARGDGAAVAPDRISEMASPSRMAETGVSIAIPTEIQVLARGLSEPWVLRRVEDLKLAVDPLALDILDVTEDSALTVEETAQALGRLPHDSEVLRKMTDLTAAGLLRRISATALAEGVAGKEVSGGEGDGTMIQGTAAAKGAEVVVAARYMAKNRYDLDPEALRTHGREFAEWALLFIDMGRDRLLRGLTTAPDELEKNAAKSGAGTGGREKSAVQLELEVTRMTPSEWEERTRRAADGAAPRTEGITSPESIPAVADAASSNTSRSTVADVARPNADGSAPRTPRYTYVELRMRYRVEE